jgi:hypothetical protein
MLAVNHGFWADCYAQWAVLDGKLPPGTCKSRRKSLPAVQYLSFRLLGKDEAAIHTRVLACKTPPYRNGLCTVCTTPFTHKSPMQQTRYITTVAKPQHKVKLSTQAIAGAQVPSTCTGAVSTCVLLQRGYVQSFMHNLLEGMLHPAIHTPMISHTVKI